MTTLPSDNPEAALVGLLTRHGCSLVETPLLQPADLFLDLSGEDIRRRLFVTQDGQGRELCLRPEHTIPVCRDHLAHARGTTRDYCYLGPVFRQRPNESGEFLQAGIESIGRSDTAPADADVAALALAGVDLFGDADRRVTIGDMGLLESVLRGLDTPDALRRRFLRDIAAGRDPVAAAAATGNPGEPAPDHAGLLAAIEGQDPKAARRFVEDVLSIAGIARIGGRSAGEIADRFLSRAARPETGLPAERAALLTRYLAIRGEPDEALAALRALAADATLEIGPALDLFEQRVGFMAAAGIDLGRLTFAANFARTLDYYSGFIFEIVQAGRVVVAGGRYDRLLRHLGSEVDVPAVGCSFWLDRLGAAGAAA